MFMCYVLNVMNIRCDGVGVCTQTGDAVARVHEVNSICEVISAVGFRRCHVEAPRQALSGSVDASSPGPGTSRSCCAQHVARAGQRVALKIENRSFEELA